MPQTLEIPSGNGNGDQIKVGTTGTVSSLMSKELETVEQSGSASQATSSSRKKLQDPPVSVPCGYSPRRSQLRSGTINDPSATTSSSSNSGSRSPADAQKAKPKPRRNEHRSPMLASAEPTLEKNTGREKLEKKKKKKGYTYIAEVVDLKCDNPMSSRLKKLGFSKLSESTP